MCCGGSLCWSALVCLQFLVARDGRAFLWSLRGRQRLRSDIRFGFLLSGRLRQTACGFEIFQMCLGWLLYLR